VKGENYDDPHDTVIKIFLMCPMEIIVYDILKKCTSQFWKNANELWDTAFFRAAGIASLFT
jgi:hypothetical protein